MNNDAILLPFPDGCRWGVLLRRIKRFIVEFELDGRRCQGHTNNSGAMLGLLRPGNPILLSPASTQNRKLAWTLEIISLPGKSPNLLTKGPQSRQHTETLPKTWPAAPWNGLLVGVNTLTPNRLLRAAFLAGQLPWAVGYTDFKPEAKRGQSRLDALLTGPNLPPLWVECKNVTLSEYGIAGFPDAVTERGQKHLREMAAIAQSGERAAFFYLVQRPDAACFAPADYIDTAYSKLFYEGLQSGVEVRPHLATIGSVGIGLGAELSLAPILAPAH